MKKLATALSILVVLAGIASYNVWRAITAPVTTTPSLVDIGRQQLHEQLEQAKRREAEIEKQDWDSVSLLRDVINAHQQRINKLSGNSQAGEIVAYDRAEIGRLEQRIGELNAEHAAPPAGEQNSAKKSGTPGEGSKPKTTPASPQP